MHDIHPEGEDAIFSDSCAECSHRAKDPLGAVLQLDDGNLPRLWNRMLNERMGKRGYASAGGYRSQNERNVGEALYLVGVLLERGSNSKPDAWDRARFGTLDGSEAAGRLEYLRGQLRAECISYGELAELQGLAEYIEPGDVELLEAAGVPEFADEAS